MDFFNEAKKLYKEIDYLEANMDNIYKNENDSMPLLFKIDTKDYNILGTVTSRPSARGIIIKDGKIAMIHSRLYEYYKFPGGGIEGNESKVDAMIREVKEETGLIVDKATVKPFGMVHRIQKGDYEDVFIQDNYYYFCDVQDEKVEQKLDDYEAYEKFVVEYVSFEQAVNANLLAIQAVEEGRIPALADKIMMDREIKVLEMLRERALV